MPLSSAAATLSFSQCKSFVLSLIVITHDGSNQRITHLMMDGRPLILLRTHIVLVRVAPTYCEMRNCNQGICQEFANVNMTFLQLREDPSILFCILSARDSAQAAQPHSTQSIAQQLLKRKVDISASQDELLETHARGNSSDFERFYGGRTSCQRPVRGSARLHCRLPPRPAPLYLSLLSAPVSPPGPAASARRARCPE